MTRQINVVSRLLLACLYRSGLHKTRAVFDRLFSVTNKIIVILLRSHPLSSEAKILHHNFVQS
jgi:hypothetical protein